MDIANEIRFKTARSGGKGGQNVNKVETMVEGYWDVEASSLITDEQKQLIREKLATKINSDGLLQIKSQTERFQLGNKQTVISKFNTLIAKALVVPKKRKKSKPSKASVAKRIDNKKKAGEIKQLRMKVKL